MFFQIRGHLARRRLLLAVEEAQRKEEERKMQKQLMQEEHEAQLPVVERVRDLYIFFDCCFREAGGQYCGGIAFVSAKRYLLPALVS